VDRGDGADEVIELELLKGDDERYVGRVALVPLVRQALRRLGVETGGGRLAISFHTSHRTGWIEAPPLRIRMDPDYDEVRVRFLYDGAPSKERQFGFGQLFAEQLTALVRPLDPDENTWTVRMRETLRGESLFGERPTPEIEGAIDVDLDRPRNLPFTVTPAAAPAEPLVSRQELGIQWRGQGSVGVLLPSSLHDLLTRDLPLSRNIEEGGFLLGRPRRLEGSRERYLVEVSHITPAEDTGAGALHFTFTGDSFRAVNEELARRNADEQLVGWYHTHLFSGGGLSDTDDRLHLNTFGRPWQVAGLINLDGERRRLRFFGRVDDTTMGDCPLWTSDDRGRYRRADAAVDER
jgi:proteasome lid subunit RPN8/RPN11